jgi:hypothetical protein
MVPKKIEHHLGVGNILIKKTRNITSNCLMYNMQKEIETAIFNENSNINAKEEAKKSKKDWNLRNIYTTVYEKKSYMKIYVLMINEVKGKIIKSKSAKEVKESLIDLFGDYKLYSFKLLISNFYIFKKIFNLN